MNIASRNLLAATTVSIGLAFFSAAQAADITKSPAGSIHENVVSIGKKQIPLPSGKWELKFSSSLPGTQKPIPKKSEGISIVLIQHDGEKYAQSIVIMTNASPGDGEGWARNRVVCDRKNVHFNRSDRNYDPLASDCWQVNHLVNVYKPSPNPVFNRLKRWARRNAGSPSFLALQYVINDAYDILRVNYIINPTAYGFPAFADKEWKYSQWHPGYVAGNADQEHAIQALRRTGEYLHKHIQKGFRNELGNYRSGFSFSIKP